jgi:hypothetical protein
VNNNPLRYTDPTGHAIWEGDGGTGGGNGNAGNCSGSACQGSGGGSNDDDDEDDDNPGGSGGHPLLSLDDPTYDCPNWNVCASDLGPEYVQDYWGSVNNFIDSYDNLTTVLGVGGIISSLAGLATYIASNGGPIATPAFLALLTGIAVVEPTPIGEALLAVGVTATIGAFVLDQSMNNLQTINNAIVTSGAYSNGGTITASLTQVQIITSTGTTTVPSFLVAQIALNSWASDNLIPAP